MLRTMIAVVLLCLNSVTVFPSVPSQLSVQGRLTDASGNPLPAGVKTFVFRVFDAANGGTELWPGGTGEIQFISTTTDGLWSADLGAQIPLSAAAFSDSVAWLEITVNDGQTLTTLPRTRLVTSPYSARVATVDGASGGVLTSGLFAIGNIAANDTVLASRVWTGGIHVGDGFSVDPNGAAIVIENGGDLSWKSSSGIVKGVLTTHVDDNVYFDAAATNSSSLIIRNQTGLIERLRLTPTGNFGLGTGPAVPYRLSLPNSATEAGVGIAYQWLAYSSRRWKTDIHTLESALDKIERLRGVSYRPKSGGGEQIGFIAEEVGAVIPEVVAWEENGIDARGMDYARLVPLLVEGMKEQQKQIESLKLEVKKLSHQ